MDHAISGDTRGRDIYRWFGDQDPVRAAEILRAHDIPGIQYLDAGSRAAGEGSRNYVMFDPALIDIVRKYAVPGAIFGGAAAPFGFVGAEQ